MRRRSPHRKGGTNAEERPRWKGGGSTATQKRKSCGRNNTDRRRGPRTPRAAEKWRSDGKAPDLRILGETKAKRYNRSDEKTERLRYSS